MSPRIAPPLGAGRDHTHRNWHFQVSLAGEEKRQAVTDTVVPSQPGLSDPFLYINRETSWLSFNARVLGEAQDASQPLLERLKFLAIYAGNLDEFFMIRVSGLHEQLEASMIETSADGLTAREQLAQIREIVEGQLEAAYGLLSKELLPGLAAKGIELVEWSALEPAAQSVAIDYFRTSVFPVLTPLAVDLAHPFPFLSNLSLSLAVELLDSDSPEHKFARVKVPESLPRFVPIHTLQAQAGTPGPSGVARYLPLEQLITANLDQLFPKLTVVGDYFFRITRDMDIEILVDEADDLLSVIDREIRRRRFGACVRLEVDRDIPERMRRFLMDKLEIDEIDVYTSTGLLGLRTLMSIATLPRPDLREPSFVPRVPAALADHASIFAAVSAQDILLHHPYDSFSAVLDFLGQAAIDPHVLAIKMTLYRAGSNSEVARRLIRAAEQGKQVAVSVELKARFDEENNIAWARKLERAGVHVFYGSAGTKTHAKLVLVVRKEGDKVQRYVHVSTGNYNAATARLYTDIGLLSANHELADDVSELFNALSGFSKQVRYRKLAVAPTGLAEAILGGIREQTDEARVGRPARIYAKMNGLVDGHTIRALYEASMAGVEIDLVVRGICCLRPGVTGISDNIRVRSIVGRLLEHERVFVFGVEGKQTYYASSADWMPRNFYKRVEVLFPIESEALRAQLRSEVIEPSLSTRVRAYLLQRDGSYVRLPMEGDEPARCMQAMLIEQVAGDPGRRNPAPATSDERR